MSDTRCKHGLRAVFCSVCTPPPTRPGSTPRSLRNDEVTAHAHVAIHSHEYALVRTQGGRANATAHLTSATRVVHIHGFPFLWAIAAILERASDVKTIQVIPSMLRELRPRHYALCAARNVTIVGGHHKPEMAWAQGVVVHQTKASKQLQRFMRNLVGPQRAQFDELLNFGFDAARMAARYYGLNGEDQATLSTIGEEFGRVSDSAVSFNIHAVIHYLDPTFDTGLCSVRVAHNLGLRVTRLRVTFASADALGQLLASHGITALPPGCPPSRLETFLALVDAQPGPAWAALVAAQPRTAHVVTQRYGLVPGTPYRTLAEVGVDLCLSRERIRQLEARALVALGVVDQDDAGTLSEVADDA